MDASALWASQGLNARGLEPLERVSAEMLAQSQRWEHRVDAKSATIDITLADGRHIRNDAIQGVLNRLVCVPFEPLRLAHPADREYASQELTAFCLSWLYALPSPVINRATSQGLAGQWRHRSEWLWLAAHAGLPIPLYRETSEASRDERDGQGRLVPPDTPVQTVFVVADQVVGATLPPHIRHGCRRLAELSHTALLGIEFAAGSAGPWTFAGATPMPDTSLHAIELPDELAERCLRLAQALGLAFAGIDLKLTPDKQAYCFEVNPSPAFSYYAAHTGQPIAQAVACYLAGTPG